jgi:uracil-DNA glycosylase
VATKKAIKIAVAMERLFGTEMALAGSGRKKEARKAMMTMEEVRDWVDWCTKCRLNEGRTTIVFGEGNEKARLVFVGEGPGADEDKQGRPFVGRAGQMLNRIIENVLGLKREDVYIANIVKCRPPGNRTPLPDECATCIPYLYKQLEIINPEIVVALGSIAAHNLLTTEETIGRLRGRFHPYGSAQLMPTYHPAYLLRNPAEKRKVLEDMTKVREALGLEPPKKE